MPIPNYKSVTIREELFNCVKELIGKLKTYHSVSEFVQEAVRIRIETLERRERIRSLRQDAKPLEKQEITTEEEGKEG